MNPQTRTPMRNDSLIPNVIFFLLIANGLMFVLQRFFWPVPDTWLALWPVGSGYFYPWQVVTYGFLHSPTNLYHIFFNMLALWMFGRDLERIMGPKRFATYWFICVIGAGLVQLLVAQFIGSNVRTVGASGGVFGLLLAFAMMFPNRTVVLLIPPIPMKAKYFVLGYGLLTLFMGVSGGTPSVAHFAHLGGMLFGFLTLRYWGRRR